MLLHLELFPRIIRRGSGRIGWWSHTEDKFNRGTAFTNGLAAAGDRTLRLTHTDAETQAMLEFFTFRAPQPDYFRGQTRPDMWSWLEVHPQHVFTNSAGQKEQMSVGVAQNAVKGRLGTMSEVGAHGRSFHRGARDTRADAVRYGLNVTEQWEGALEEDPRFMLRHRLERVDHGPLRRVQRHQAARDVCGPV